MPDTDKRNRKSRRPFETHIEGKEFDVSPLSPEEIQITCDVIHPRLEELLDSLPQPLDEGGYIWDNLLDDMQEQLRSCLVVEIIDRVLRPNFEDLFQDVDDDDLAFLLTFPITLSMIALEHFRKNGYPKGWDKPEGWRNEDSST
jgi:hypothetical protein